MTMVRTVLLSLCVLTLAATAQAERFLIQRGSALLVASREGETRKLAELGTTTGTLWAASPDGHRVVWLKPTAGVGDGNLATRPVTVFLTDITGRHQKKLFSTDTLHDRLGRSVTLVGPNKDNAPASAFSDWQVVSLAFSADGRTLYLGCTRLGASEVTTVAVDAQSGAALVDADGNWKSIAPVAQVDARAGQLAAVGVSDEVGVAPLMLVDLAQGGLLARVPVGTSKPEYGAALWPALSPDGTSVAFTSVPRGLWLSEGRGARLKRLSTSEVNRPRWSSDNKLLYFLAPQPVTIDKATFDLYTLPRTGGSAKLVLQNVDWFEVIPD